MFNIHSAIWYDVCCDIICNIGEYYVNDGAEWLEWATLSRSVYNEFTKRGIKYWITYNNHPCWLKIDKLQFSPAPFDVISVAIQRHKPQYLDISLCGLETLPDCRDIIYLDCSLNNISGIIYAPQLLYLFCNFTRITKISADNLKQLCCSGCEHIELPYAPNLRVLECCSCKIIGVLPIYPKLEYINAFNNHNLTGVVSCKNYIYNTKLRSVHNSFPSTD